MHNIYINNILYIVSTPPYFDAPASSSGSLTLPFAKVTKLHKSYKIIQNYNFVTLAKYKINNEVKYNEGQNTTKFIS